MTSQVQQIKKIKDWFKSLGNVNGWIENGRILPSGGVPQRGGEGSGTNGATTSRLYIQVFIYKLKKTLK